MKASFFFLAVVIVASKEAGLADSCEPTGGCISNLADEASVPSDGNPYVVSEIEQGCAPFGKHIRVYGMLLLADVKRGKKVSDDSLKWLAHAATELFPPGVSDPEGQKKILEAMFRFRAATPIFAGRFQDFGGSARDYMSLCDQITVDSTELANEPNNQLMEVYEHLLHMITDVGLHHAFPTRWGVSKTSDLYLAMQEAINAGVYDASDYAGIKPANDRLRVEMQEFAYFALSTAQGIHARFFDGETSEWTISKVADMKTKLPLFWKLHTETTARWMGKISEKVLKQLRNMAPGGNSVASAPWPIVVNGRGNVMGDVVSASICAKPKGTCKPAACDSLKKFSCASKANRGRCLWQAGTCKARAPTNFPTKRPTKSPTAFSCDNANNMRTCRSLKYRKKCVFFNKACVERTKFPTKAPTAFDCANAKTLRSCRSFKYRKKCVFFKNTCVERTLFPTRSPTSFPTKWPTGSPTPFSCANVKNKFWCNHKKNREQCEYDSSAKECVHKTTLAPTEPAVDCPPFRARRNCIKHDHCQWTKKSKKFGNYCIPK